MGKRGPKPTAKVKINWSPNFAYAIGLIATDGNLSPDGRHINLTSKDKEMVNNFQRILSISYKTGRKSNGSNRRKIYYVVQFSDMFFYKFLNSIGLFKNKSKTISRLAIPQKYFFDFLRGCFDGDGYSYSYWDKRWKSSFMFYAGFASASRNFIDWLRKSLFKTLKIKGHITTVGREGCYQLKYAKFEASLLFNNMYYSKNVVCLKRKRLKIERALAIVGDR